MKVVINITLTDDTSEEKMIAAGVTRQNLHDIYDVGFGNLIRKIANPGVKVERCISVMDNTKE